MFNSVHPSGRDPAAPPPGPEGVNGGDGAIDPFLADYAGDGLCAPADRATTGERPAMLPSPFQTDFSEMMSAFLMAEGIGDPFQRKTRVDHRPYPIGFDGADHRQMLLAIADR